MVDACSCTRPEIRRLMQPGDCGWPHSQSLRFMFSFQDTKRMTRVTTRNPHLGRCPLAGVDTQIRGTDPTPAATERMSGVGQRMNLCWYVVFMSFLYPTRCVVDPFFIFYIIQIIVLVMNMHTNLLFVLLSKKT